MACKAENNVPAVGAREAARGRTISWMQVLTEEDETRPGEVKRFLPRPCLQCDDPPCTKVCPVKATYRNPEGLVAQIYPRCIGCRYCMAACPYTAKLLQLASVRRRRRPGAESGRLGAAQGRRGEVHLLPSPPAARPRAGTRRAAGPGPRATTFPPASRPARRAPWSSATSTIPAARSRGSRGAPAPSGSSRSWAPKPKVDLPDRGRE